MIASDKSCRVPAAEKPMNDDNRCAGDIRHQATATIQFTLSVAALFLYVVTQPVIANGQLNPFYNQEAGPSLHDDDWALMHAAAARLYRQEQVADGAATRWSNPKTGDSGAVTVLQSFEENGMACRRVRYNIELCSSPGPYPYTLNWCRTASRKWKIAS